MQRPAGPDFLAIDHIFIAVFDRFGLQVGRVGTAGRLGHTKCLKAQLTGGDLRQILCLLLRAAVAQQRPHNVHLGMAGTGVTAGLMDCLQNDAGGPHRQTSPAIFFRNKRAKESGFRQFFDEISRITGVIFQLAPVFTGIFFTDFGHRFPNFRIVETKVQCRIVAHQITPPRSVLPV